MTIQVAFCQARPPRPVPAWARASLAVGLAGLLLLLGGCASKGTRQASDGFEYRELDPDSIADAIPRAEPRSKSGNMASYEVDGKRYYTKSDNRGHVERGLASWYGNKFNGRKTSSGERYDMYGMTAAHKTLPLPSYARVTNLENGRSAVVRINDRGPFHGPRVIDLSYAAAVKIGVFPKGSARVEVRAIDPADGDPGPQRALAADLEPDTYRGVESGLEPAPAYAVADNGAIAQSLVIARRGSGPTRQVQPQLASTRERAVATAVAAVESGSDEEVFAALSVPTRPVSIRKPAPEAVVKSASRPARLASQAPIAPATKDKPQSKAQAKTPEAAKPAKVAGGGGVYLQVGAFGDPKNAERLRQRLSSQLGTQVRVQQPSAGAGSLYKVRVGPLAPADAKRVSVKLASLGVKQPRSLSN